MKLWGGRFEKDTSKLMDDFHSSIGFDARLYKEDIEGSIAHARMLGKTGIISVAEAKAIEDGLTGILQDIESGGVTFTADAEDIHMNIEKLLTERIGDAGKKLHTGRSRNDQVALDMRMYAKRSIKEVQERLYALCALLLDLAEQHHAHCMPGYTHLQKAQPVTLGHHLMAYFQMFTRDYGRFADCFKRTDVMPLGSGALAATTYPLDREMVARELGFSAVTQNSLDAVSDRDFCIEFASCAAICMMHLSRLCEEIILWSTGEFAFAVLDDAYSTGSSIMPQKKNPDVAELVRGKTGRVYGDLTALLTMMKGLPLAYNKDMQEDKEAFFDARDTLLGCLDIFTPMLQTLSFNVARMEESALNGFTNATDLADYLVTKGMPFRDAHEVSGSLVLSASKQGRGLLDFSLTELREFSELFADDVFEAISLNSCVSRRSITGGPSPDTVLASIAAGRRLLDRLKTG
ncbi:MAG: argininosuccinate lyase [Bacillota bacterium]